MASPSLPSYSVSDYFYDTLCLIFLLMSASDLEPSNDSPTMTVSTGTGADNRGSVEEATGTELQILVNNPSSISEGDIAVVIEPQNTNSPSTFPAASDGAIQSLASTPTNEVPRAGGEVISTGHSSNTESSTNDSPLPQLVYGVEGLTVASNGNGYHNEDDKIWIIEVNADGSETWHGAVSRTTDQDEFQSEVHGIWCNVQNERSRIDEIDFNSMWPGYRMIFWSTVDYDSGVANREFDMEYNCLGWEVLIEGLEQIQVIREEGGGGADNRGSVEEATGTESQFLANDPNSISDGDVAVDIEPQNTNSPSTVPAVSDGAIQSHASMPTNEVQRAGGEIISNGHSSNTDSSTNDSPLPVLVSGVEGLTVASNGNGYHNEDDKIWIIEVNADGSETWHGAVSRTTDEDEFQREVHGIWCNVQNERSRIDEIDFNSMWPGYSMIFWSYVDYDSIVPLRQFYMEYDILGWEILIQELKQIQVIREGGGGEGSGTGN